MNQIRNTLLKQRTEFVEKLAPALADCGHLQAELKVKLEVVRALQISISQIDAAVAAVDEDEAKRSMGRPTIMQVVLNILERAPDGMTAREIMTEINSSALLGEPIVRHSLSPQLSRLKDRDRKIELRGDRWYLLPDEPSLFTSKS